MKIYVQQNTEGRSDIQPLKLAIPSDVEDFVIVTNTLTTWTRGWL